MQTKTLQAFMQNLNRTTDDRTLPLWAHVWTAQHSKQPAAEGLG